MKLRSLRLHGFKSFADRTEVVFHDGITAIVGPNGCGKSNISDAIRWVLGEQRPTAIRGARMEEAIFQGTVNRRPVNRGSVAMVVGNEDGALPVPFEEVEIARTVYRDGGSEYSLNRSTCRLRDIHDLYRDTGLGANAYSIIENRMIDAILSDRAEERRGLFEEAAGIGKYKDRRKAASRRLERAELDLQRLEDVISEVETKVRSLSRQKGKAERYAELRKRRLDVEVAVVRTQLDELHSRSKELHSILQGGMQRGVALEAEIQSVESRVEALRTERIGAERARVEAAGAVDQIRTRLATWERDLAVAEERAAHAERRLLQIERDRGEAQANEQRTGAEADLLQVREGELQARLDRLRAEEERRRELNSGVRARLTEARGALDAVEEREREVARRIAQLQGDAEAAEAHASDMALRLAHLEEEIEASREALARLNSQGDLFGDELLTRQERVEEARGTLDDLRGTLSEARDRLGAARKAELEAEDRAASLETRVDALQGMEQNREGMEPVVRALLEKAPDGVLGVVADFVRAEPRVVRAVEAWLGSLARAVVVRDQAVARELALWFREEWKGGGGLLLLPNDRVPPVKGTGELLELVEVEGAGAPWVRALLDGVELASPEAREGEGNLARSVHPEGFWVESEGVIRVGNPFGGAGFLERRAQLEALREEAESARAAAESAHQARIAAETELAGIERSLEEARARFRSSEDEMRTAEAEEMARSESRRRIAQTEEDLERQLATTRDARTRAEERSRSARAERETFLAEEEGFRSERSEARERLDQTQEEWEAARAEESRLTVERTREEGEAARVRERIEELERVRVSARERVQALDLEERELRDAVTQVAELRERGKSEIESLFAERTEAESVLSARDRTLAELQDTLAGAEKAAREARSAEREASESRHRLELEAQEIEGRIGRIEERLEGEWGRPLARLLEQAEPVEGEDEALREELREIVQALDRIGPVNMLAMEEHEEESARLTFLTEQRDDLVEARNDLRSAIREINQTATRLFRETFEAIRENFRKTFLHLFEGGEADLWLEDADDPLESVIEIHASPRGKRTQRIDLLSGGERALTALSLLFGIYLVKPSPFCVLDEVDAPLDEANIGRFIRLLQDFKHQTQFVVITHNPRTIEAADWIYGVTMEEAGVSNIVGVRLEEALEVASA